MEQETQHTPGPWTAEILFGARRLNLYAGGILVGEGLLMNAFAPAGQNEANARLIAAARDLLAACKRLDDINLGEHREAVDAAIAKAGKGES